MDYATLSNTLATFAVVSVSDTNFVIALPQIITSAENKIYRDCDFINQRAAATVDTVASTRTVTLPVATGAQNFKVVQNINLVTPAATAPNAGTRTPLERVSRDYLDFVWPSASISKGPPQYYALLDDQTVILAPTPDAIYKLEVIGTYRPLTMSAVNTATYLGDNYPDLLFAACMRVLSGYQKNFGSMADDPRMALSWDQEYKELVQSAVTEAFRQKGEGESWTPYNPSPLANNPRP